MLPRSLTPNTSSLCLVSIQESHFDRPGCLGTQQPTCLHVSPGGIAYLHHHVLLFCFMTILSYPGLIPPPPKEEEVGRKEGKLLHADQIHVEPSLFGGWLSVYFPFFSPQRFYNIFVCKQVFLFVSHELLLHNVMSPCTVIHRK